MLDKSNQKVEWLPTKNISVVWAHAQRPFDAKREKAAEKIAAEFDPDEFGTVTVTLPNGHGVYHCVDGQTRVAAVRMLWGDTQRVPCTIVHAKDPARAAEIFLKINTGRTPPSAIENFHVAVTAGREAEVEIHKLVTSMGWKLDQSKSDGSISCVTALLNIYKRDGLNVLRDTLVVIRGIWGEAREAVESNIVRGVATLLAEHPGADRNRLIRKVTEDRSLDPNRLVAKGRLRKEAVGGSVAYGIASVLAEAYNHKLRGKKLEM